MNNIHITYNCKVIYTCDLVKVWKLNQWVKYKCKQFKELGKEVFKMETDKWMFDSIFTKTKQRIYFPTQSFFNNSI